MKEKFTNIIILLSKVMLAGLTAIIILSVFCLGYSYTGAHITNEYGSTDYKWIPNQIISKMDEGFAWNRMDKNGFHNVENAQSVNPQILLMGSSHMEAMQIPTKQTVGALLNEKYSTYNIGISGHTIYTCVKNIDTAVSQYGPTKYVVLETDTVDLDAVTMSEVCDNTYATIPSYDSGLLFQIQKYVPAVKSIYKGIDDWRKADSRNNIAGEEAKPGYDDNYKNILNEFIQKASAAAKKNGSKLIIFYHPLSRIDGEGKLMDMTNAEALNLFANACMENDVVFIDMTQPFEKLYNTKNRLAHGFSNTAVGVGHLNKYGHEVIANTLLSTINSIEMRYN